MCPQSSVIGGVVFYEKYERFTVFEWICLPIALLCKWVSSNQLFALILTPPGSIPVIIVGIYLLSKHGEDEGSGASETDGEQHAHLMPRGALTSGHFGALMPLSPTHSHSRSFASHKAFDDEHTPLRGEPRLHSSVVIHDRRDSEVVGPKNRRGSM